MLFINTYLNNDVKQYPPHFLFITTKKGPYTWLYMDPTNKNQNIQNLHHNNLS